MLRVLLSSSARSLAHNKSIAGSVGAAVAAQSATFHRSAQVQSNFHPNASHINTADNTEETFFDFSAENYKRVSG
jgi:uncharacterized protein (DUF697 family)